MNAEIITIGDEILIGQIIDTNSSWLGQQLGSLGIRVVHRTSVGDSEQDILNALKLAKGRAEIILMTGGLGPTKDDITKNTLCKFFGTDLVRNEKVHEWVNHIFTSRNLPFNEANQMQAMVPSNCKVLFNKSGTAPGMWFDVDHHIFISLPGVPFEMMQLFADEVLPLLKQRFELPAIVHRTIQTVSIGESFLAAKISAWEDALPSHIKLAYLPSVGAVRLRLSAYGDNKADLESQLEPLISELYNLAGEFIFGEENDSLQKVIGVLLNGKGQTLSTAESCSGGYISHLITSVPGSSSYYKGSVIAYSNEVKVSELRVKAETLKSYGAVSEECAREMAEGGRKKFGVDYCIASTGIAGPDGGTTEKPVGTVWIAVSSASKTITKKMNLGDHRGRTIERTALMGMYLLRKMILAE